MDVEMSSMRGTVTEKASSMAFSSPPSGTSFSTSPLSERAFVPGLEGFFLMLKANAKLRTITARTRNCVLGKPGMKLRPTIKQPATRRALGWESSCMPISLPRGVFSSEATRVTIIPEVMEIRRAGICVTIPSPMVRMP